MKTSYVDEEECEAVTREKCAPVTREECSQVVDKVPHQSTKEVSRIKSRLFIHYYFYFALYRSATLFIWKTVYSVYHFPRIFPRRFLSPFPILERIEPARGSVQVCS